MNLPTKLNIKYSSREDVVADIPIAKCSDILLSTYFEYVVHKYGIVGSDCISNTAIPSSTDTCTEPEGKYERYLVGYKLGRFYGSNDAAKEALIKFGPFRNSDYLFIGWEDDRWITVETSSGGYVLNYRLFIPD